MPIQFSPSHRQACWANRRAESSSIGCTILAAGLGRRLEPLTVRYLPKPLFPIGGKAPMVETWVRKMVDSGIDDISMNLCVLKHAIRSHFRDGAKYGARIRYVEEETPTGTLGGVCKQVLGSAAQSFPGEAPLEHEPFPGTTVFAPSGDIVTNFDSALLEQLYDLHRARGSAMTMVLVPIEPERRKDFGTAVLRDPVQSTGSLSGYGRIVDFHEKDPNSPSLLNNASIYVIDVRFLRELDALRTPARLDVPAPFYDFGKHVFPALLGRLPYAPLARDNQLWGVPYDGAWFDVGQKRDYLRVNELALDGTLDVSMPYERLPWGYLGTDVAIDFSKVTIIPPVVIGNRCTIENGATLGPYAVIGDDWLIEHGARIEHSVLWERYPLVRADGSQYSSAEMRLLDRHEVRDNMTVRRSILTSGSIDRDIEDSTVEVLEDGSLSILPIDYHPAGPRT